MNTCKTCKHWDNLNVSGTGWDDEGSIHRECASPKINQCQDGDGLHLDNDGYWPLTTGADFGCIHWEERV